ncbi:GntR family transcriptional regulator [Phytohalomonas tamaricis]|uniref:GntR family transcriptional regulator n=1 Tax=Phytohalomonas tamaricis TaxID=2081032 RepID=UPI000D0BB83B|nr:GntR family transcriptional regulator [Phytohalomonas tamaricis]
MKQSLKALLTLREWILSGTLTADERLWEPALAKRLEVSRTPLREALVRLEGEGLIIAAPEGGYQVRAFDRAYLQGAIEVRGTLEGLAARRAAEARPSAAALKPLHVTLDALDRVVAQHALDSDDFDAYMTFNERFHDAILRLAGSQPLEEALARIVSLPFASPSAFVMAQSLLPRSHEILFIAQDQHRCLVEAIAAGQGARAEQIAREHAQIARRNLDVALGDHAMLERVSGAPLIRACLGAV